MDMEEKGIVAQDYLLSAGGSPGAQLQGVRELSSRESGSSAPGSLGAQLQGVRELSSRESPNGNNPFLLHVAVQSGLQIDVEVEEPDVGEPDLTLFKIHYIIRRRTQLLAVK